VSCPKIGLQKNQYKCKLKLEIMKKKNRKVPFYSEELKKRVVKEILEKKQTISSACEGYSIGSERSVYRWIKKFRKFVEAKKKLALPIMKKESKELTREELLEVKRKLEKELKQALLKAEANQILIEIAKKEFNLDLEKKHGAKQ